MWSAPTLNFNPLTLQLSTWTPSIENSSHTVHKMVCEELPHSITILYYYAVHPDTCTHTHMLYCIKKMWMEIISEIAGTRELPVFRVSISVTSELHSAINITRAHTLHLPLNVICTWFIISLDAKCNYPVMHTIYCIHNCQSL